MLEGKLPLPCCNDESQARLFAIAADDNLSTTVKDVCKVALSGVGRQQWGQKHIDLLQADPKDIAASFNLPVVCWASPLMWACLGGALSKSKVKAFSNACTNAGTTLGPAGTNNKARQLLFDHLAHTAWAYGAVVPVGAMAFHQAGANPIAHVTLHVGANKIVSCWRGQYAESPDMKLKVENLLDSGHSGDTVLCDITSFGTTGPTALYYTNQAFWDLW